jgi:EAL domain-containing protein (putative c-di-GMP-specific phosphodiesterase class I)
VVDQTTMSTPGVSHPSPTTAEDFRRALDERAVQPVFQPVVELDDRDLVIRAAEPLLRRLVPER